MTTKRRGSFVVDATPAAVWAFIQDPENRADAIKFVTDYRRTDDPDVTEWQVSLPMLDAGVWLATEDTEVEEPTFVRFVGRARIGKVVGEYRVEPVGEEQSRIVQMLEVESWVPGVERAFKRQFDDAFAYFEDAVRRGVET